MSTQAVRRSTKERAAVWPTIQAALAKMDYQLIAIVATLLLVGLVMVFSASFAKVGTQFFLAQLKWVAVGVVACAVVAMIPYEFWRKMAIPAMGFTIVILVAVLVIGPEERVRRSAHLHRRTLSAERIGQAWRRDLRRCLGRRARPACGGLQAGLLSLCHHHRARGRPDRARAERQHDHHRARNRADDLLRRRRCIQAASAARGDWCPHPVVRDVAIRLSVRPHRGLVQRLVRSGQGPARSARNDLADPGG